VGSSDVLGSNLGFAREREEPAELEWWFNYTCARIQGRRTTGKKVESMVRGGGCDRREGKLEKESDEESP